MTSPVMTSQDYLQRMRERRQVRYVGNSDPNVAPAQTIEPTQAPAEPTPPLTQVAPLPQEPIFQQPQQDVSQPTQNPPPEVQPATQLPTQPFQEEILLEWIAPSRPFKKRNARFYTTITVIVVLISLILFFAGQFLPIAAVVAVAFLGYVLASVPPEQIQFQLTTAGIKVDDTFYIWEEMGAFWLDRKYGQDFIQIEVPRFPFRLIIMLGELPTNEMQLLLSQILPEQKPTQTYIDKIAAWVEKNVLLDEPA